MIVLFDSFAYKCLKIISFRSKAITYNFLLDSKSILKMSATLEQLKLRQAQASQVIEKLKKQVELIKLQTTPAYMAEKAKVLQKENELLKKRVEDLKKELELAESKKSAAGSAPSSLIAAPVVKTESTKKEPSVENTAGKTKAVSKEAPAKTTPKPEAKKAESKNTLALKKKCQTKFLI